MQLSKLKTKMRGTATDSLLLTFVKVVSAALGLLTSKVLSTQFTLQENGTYSQAMLLVSTVTSISILGLSDAVNYFYNAADDDETKQRNIATVFGIQYFIGILSGLLICAFSVPITAYYFKNDDLYKIIFFAAWMPVFNNLLPMLQVLFISIGKAKVIAVRNFIVSVMRLAAVAVAAFLTKNIVTVFIIILALDVAQVVYFYVTFSKSRFPIRMRLFSRKMIKPILAFSIPMAVFVFTSALSRDIDKYVISFFTDTETLAIYTYAAKVLPFDMLTASFLTVLVPIITRQVRGEKFEDAQTTLRSYLRIGYLVTWILVTGAIVNAKEMMLFFYDEKYLPGLGVFILYLFVDMIKFANASLVLSAKGRTKTLMTCSLIALGANLVLNIAAFHLFGIIGPAITTLVVTFGLMVTLVTISAREIHTTIWRLFNWKEVGLIVLELCAVGAGSYGLKLLLYRWISSFVLVLILTYGFFLAVMLLLNYKRIFRCLKEINALK